jgi:hypothetical protein
LKITSPTAKGLTRAAPTPAPDKPSNLANFILEVPSTVARVKSTFATGKVVVVTTGIVVTGTVEAGIETSTESETRHTNPAATFNETGLLHWPNPFLFFARATTLKVFPEETFLTTHFLAFPTARQEELPTFTSVNNKGAFAWVTARPKPTVTSTLPFTAREETLIVFTNTNEGFAEIETAETCDCD